MSTPAIRFYDEHPGTASLREEVHLGLARKRKAISPKFFYDERGSQLFDRICEQPEYYPTRTEIGILQDNARAIADLAGRGALLIELGSGASKKVRLLLEALQPAAYLGVDISRDFLRASTERLARDYPWLEVHAACADFSSGLSLPQCPESFRRVAFYPGSSIGNFQPHEALEFLRSVRSALGPDGALLVGVDLKKDKALLDAAYNDAEGVTAAFNLNLLHRIRNELDSDVDPSAFEHRAFYNEALGRVEMHLVSRDARAVRVEDRIYLFEPDETIHTECSYKYSVAEFQSLARQAGYRPQAVWTDERQLFSVHYLGQGSAS